jgi:hypothetical protein
MLKYIGEARDILMDARVLCLALVGLRDVAARSHPNSPIHAELVLSNCRHWFSNVACCKQ